jgi:putative heme-binding domain-containing protein
MCDWSEGRILAVTLQPLGGTYQAQSELFLEGKPLNCSDIAVGPDGWLYFSVGGRGTAGSIFRIVAKQSDSHPATAGGVRSAVGRALDQPQLNSAWARRALREAQAEAGDQWEKSLVAVATNPRVKTELRVRALDLMQRSLAAPSNELLVQLSADPEQRVRAKATYLLGIHATTASNARLIQLLDDTDTNVRRLACESLVRAKVPAPAEKLIAMLGSDDRFLSWAARRALEAQPRDAWQAAVLAAPGPRAFIQGAVALETLGVDRATAGSILNEAGKWLAQNPADNNTLDLLRVIELALLQGGFQGEEQAALRSQISGRFPASDYRLNRELVRTLVMLQDPTLAPRLVSHLQGKAPLEERIQAAMLARFLSVGWTPELRTALLDFFSLAKQLEGGNSYRGYLTNAANDVLKSMPPEEQLARIREGLKNPAAALSIVQNLGSALSPEITSALRELDTHVAQDRSPPAQELARATVLALGRGDESVLPYLRQVFETSPDRRQDAAQALATFALTKSRRAEDFPLFVRALPIVEGSTARDVLKVLSGLPQKSDKPQELRQVIVLGLRLGDQGGREAAGLLTHWTGKRVAAPRSPWQTSLAAWQKWFAETYPDQPEAVLPVDPSDNKYTFAQLLAFVTSPEGAQGDLDRGAAIFEKAQCIKCHRYGTRGEGIGPDLSTVSSRFQRKEILESVVFPSHIISDQFAAKTVVTKDGKTFTGLVGPTGDGVVVLQANTEKAAVTQNDISEIVASKKSAMPDGLFNTLSLGEIADLFAYLGRPPASK